MMWQIRWLNRSIATIIATLHLIYIYKEREREKEKEREREREREIKEIANEIVAEKPLKFAKEDIGRLPTENISRNEECASSVLVWWKLGQSSMC